MNWTSDEAESICGDLIQQLQNLRPQLKFERAGAKNEDGLIYFTNTHGTHVKVMVSQEALRDYVVADDRDQVRKERQLADCFDRIDSEDVGEALVKSEHLAP